GTFSVAAGSSARLVATGSNSFLDNGVTLNNPIDMDTFGGSLTVRGGLLTLNSVLNVGKADASTLGNLRVNSSASPAGNGTIAFGGHPSNTVSQSGSNLTLTFGPGITIRGKYGTIGSGDAVINQGNILADVAGGTLTVNLGSGGRNDGTMAALNGSNLTVAG